MSNRIILSRQQIQAILERLRKENERPFAGDEILKKGINIILKSQQRRWEGEE